MAKSNQILFKDVESGELFKAARIMRSIAHPLRLKILAFIDKNKTAHVHKIYTGLGIEQSIASQQLNILRAADMVKTQRDGKYINYSVNYAHITQLLALLEKYKLR
ncbi:MAG: metalloregulator ArsR/SmtB family transcription factor [Chitinophagales bacterium]